MALRPTRLAVLAPLGLVLMLGLEPATTRADDEARERELRALLHESRTVIDGYRAAVDRREFDVGARAASLGGDVAAILSFVRSEIAYEPYRGILRGPAGCLRARAGNSWDRALLLTELLRAHGRRVQLVWGRLDEPTATWLVEEFVSAHPGATELDLPYSIDSEELAAERARAVEALTARTRGRFRRLLDALDACGILAAAPVAAGLDPELVTAAREHAWVRVETERGQIDLDPSAADAPGATLTSATATADQPPGEQWREVVLRARLETLKAKQVEERELFTHTQRSADLSGAPVIVEVERAEEGFNALAGALSGEGAQRKLVLRIDGRVVASKEFPLIPANDAGGGGGGPFGALSGALGGDRPKTATVSVSLTVTTCGPGEPAGDARVFLVDRWGHAGRSTRDSTSLDQLSDDDGWSSTLDNTAVSIGITTGPACPGYVQDKVLELTQRKLAAFAFENGRLHFRGGPVADLDARLLSDCYDHQLDAFEGLAAGTRLVDAVRITAVVMRRDRERASVAFDVSRDDPRAIDDGFTDPRRSRLERGLLSSIIEEELTLDPLAESATAAGGAAHALEAALAAGPPRVARAADEVPGTLSADARARLSTALREGRLVILPSSDPSNTAAEWTWFELAKDGRLRAFAQSGLHQGLTEYGVSQKSNATRAGAASRAGNALRGVTRCIVHNVNTLVFLAIDAGSGGLDLGSAQDAAQGIAQCLSKMRGKPAKGRPRPPQRHRTTPDGERHIRDRHIGTHPDFPDKSKWTDSSEWRRQRETLGQPDRVWRQPDGRWRYERQFDKPVGTGPNGEPCRWVRTIVEPNGDVVTSFPASGPWTP